MRKLFKKLNDQSGVALILTLGILTLLLTLGVAFVMNMTLESGGAVQHDYRVKARLVAEAGIERAIMELRAKAKSRSFEGPRDPFNGWAVEDWFYDRFNEHPDLYGNPAKPSYANLDGTSADNKYTEVIGIEVLNANLSHVGKCVLKIRDCSSMVNINDWNPNLKTILTGLFQKLGVSSAATIVNNIYSKREELGHKFATKEQVKLATGVSDGIYDTIKDYITVYSYIDQNTMNPDGVTEEPRAPVNMNTAPKVILKTVMECLEGVGDQASEAVANVIIQNRPLTFWSGFDNWIDTIPDGTVSSTTKQLVKDNANPNRKKPSPYSTEFSFNSGGYYEIESTGKIYKRVGNVDIKVAEKTITAVVRIYKVKNITKKSQFDGTDDPNAKAYKTTVADSCPINSKDNRKGDPTEDRNYVSSKYFVIKNAAKLGFWDNFRKDMDEKYLRFYSADNGWCSETETSSPVWVGRPTDSTFTIDTTDHRLKLGGGYGPVGDLVGYGKTDADASQDKAYVWKEFGVQMELTDINAANSNKAEGPRDVKDPYGDAPIYDEVTGAIIHRPGTFGAPSGGDNYTGFTPGVKCVLGNGWDFLNDSPDDWHNRPLGDLPPELQAFGDQVQKEWPVPQNHVANLLFNRSGGADDKVFVVHYQPDGDGQFSGEIRNASYFWTYELFKYKPQKDIYLMASSDIYFGLVYDDTNNRWKRMGFATGRTMATGGTVGVWGKGDWGFEKIHVPHAKIGYVRIIPGSPGSQYLFDKTNMIEESFQRPTLTGEPTVDEFGYWESEFDAGQVVSWGTIAGTITLPDHSRNNKPGCLGVVFVTGNETGWSAPKDFVISKKGILTADSQKLKFRALFINQDDKIHFPRWDDAVAADPFYSESPVLEDVTITYLPKAEILYSREMQK